MKRLIALLTALNLSVAMGAPSAEAFLAEESIAELDGGGAPEVIPAGPPGVMPTDVHPALPGMAAQAFALNKQETAPAAPSADPVPVIRAIQPAQAAVAQVIAAHKPAASASTTAPAVKKAAQAVKTTAAPSVKTVASVVAQAIKRAPPAVKKVLSFVKFIWGRYLR